MTVTELITVLSNLATLIFVISSMLALGLSLTVQQILKPLTDVNLVVRALLANFVLVPLVAFLLKTVIPLDPSLGIGLFAQRLRQEQPVEGNRSRSRLPQEESQPQGETPFPFPTGEALPTTPLRELPSGNSTNLIFYKHLVP